MLKSGIVIDDWKLSIFKKHLDQSGFEYTINPGITKNTLVLMVKSEFVSDVQKIAISANTECKNSKRH
jgi:hypothetical protein